MGGRGASIGIASSMTTSTENILSTLTKENNRYANTLEYLRNELLSSVGYYGSNVAEAASHGVDLPNSLQFNPTFNISETQTGRELNGLSARFPNFINVMTTHDLNTVTIKDFNKLVGAFHRSDLG